MLTRLFALLSVCGDHCNICVQQGPGKCDAGMCQDYYGYKADTNECQGMSIHVESQSCSHYQMSLFSRFCSSRLTQVSDIKIHNPSLDYISRLCSVSTHSWYIDVVIRVPSMGAHRGWGKSRRLPSLWKMSM